jgi:RNA polymerase sigma-70 factor, ECF subfamily
VSDLVDNLLESNRRLIKSRTIAEVDAFDADLGKLLLKIREKDFAAFAELYKQTSGTLYGIVYRILRRHDLAGDALQDVYEKIWKNAARFYAGPGSPLGWMATIARRTALDRVRRVEPISLEDMPAASEPFVEFDPLESRDRRETLKTLMACLTKLDARKRELLMLAYYSGASREELARRMGVPVPTIKSQLRRALIELNRLCAEAQI